MAARCSTKHARSRLLRYLALELTNDVWREIASNARAGLYTKQRPRAKHPRGCRSTKRKRSAIYRVPLRAESWAVYVPMAINTNEAVVVTVIPPGPNGYEHLPE